jgi:membrane fusion protein, multidrug efflux system
MDIGQASGGTSTALPPPGARARRSGRGLRLGAVGLALLAVLAGGFWFTHRLLTLVFVDDARVAADMVVLASRVPGWVAEVGVIAGDEVASGALLVRIDSRDSELAVRELEARLAGLAARRRELEARMSMVDLQTESQQAASRARLEVARAALPAALAERLFAESEFGRANQLMSTGSGTRQRHDQARSTLDSARQKVLAATAEIQNAEDGLAAAAAGREELRVLQRQLEALEPQERELSAQRDRAALDLRDRTILMPFAGTVDRVFVDPGARAGRGQREGDRDPPLPPRHPRAPGGGRPARPAAGRRGGAGGRRRHLGIRAAAGAESQRQLHQDHPAPAHPHRPARAARGKRAAPRHDGGGRGGA